MFKEVSRYYKDLEEDVDKINRKMRVCNPYGQDKEV
jgi:hypothetical protein